MSRVVTGPGYHQQRSTNKPSLNVSKGDDSFYQQKDEWSDSEGSVGDDSLSEDLEEEVDCPLCLEDMDESDQHFFPCPCQYQVLAQYISYSFLIILLDLPVLLAQDQGGGE